MPNNSKPQADESDFLQNINICVLPDSSNEVSFQVIDSNDETRIGTNLEPTPGLYRVYLLNDGKEKIDFIDIDFNGYDGSGEEFIQLPNGNKTVKHNRGNQLFLIDEFEYWALDFVMNYNITLHFADKTTKKIFSSINKAYGLKEKTMYFEPLLDASVYHQDVEYTEENEDETTKTVVSHNAH